MTNEPQNPELNPEQQPEDFETEFHYPAGKLEEEVVRDPHGGWAQKDFDSEDFDYEFDESEFDDSEFGEADFGEEEEPTEGDAPLSEEEWEEIYGLAVAESPCRSYTKRKVCLQGGEGHELL